MNFEELKQHRAEILVLAAKYRATNIRVFGSLARNTSHPDSIDEGQTWLDLIGLQQDLEALLGCFVDVAQSTALHPRIRAKVLSEAIAL